MQIHFELKKGKLLCLPGLSHRKCVVSGPAGCDSGPKSWLFIQLAKKDKSLRREYSVASAKNVAQTLCYFSRKVW